MPLPAHNDAAKDLPREPLRALPAAAAVPELSKARRASPAFDLFLASQSDPDLTALISNPPTASFHASTLSPSGSRSMSPSGRKSPPQARSGQLFDSSSRPSSRDRAFDHVSEPHNIVLRYFVPHVAVYSSEDTDLLIAEKGFKHGLWELLRPFGEKVQGRITIHDSNGISHAVENFAIRFINFGNKVEPSSSGSPEVRSEKSPEVSFDPSAGPEADAKSVVEVEDAVERHISYAEHFLARLPHEARSAQLRQLFENESPHYTLYLRRLLTGASIAPHETFAHPVACVVAISSRNSSPLEELRNLYIGTNQGAQSLPAWVESDYLRFYLLVHDEENDDITRTLALFEQMKRHLGLHCHLLRLRCSQSAETDDDSVPLPPSEWLSAAEDLALMNSNEDGDLDDQPRFIFESDATAIRSFVRELVTLSIVPLMERQILLWNDQVAARRRGLTGRFMNLSRKWTGFGSSSRSSYGGNNSSKDHFDATGYYRTDAQEAILRKLADYAFMLRDWKLAQSIYDLLRSDFNEAKAWKFHAAANEMAAISLLLAQQSKIRIETLDLMIESAVYSYTTRCGAPYGALRTLLLSHELLRQRGGSFIDDAGRWGLRLVESRLLGNIGDALFKERLASCFSSKTGVGTLAWGSRRRKAALWNLLASDAWFQQAKYVSAQRCLTEAQKHFDSLPHKQGISKFLLATEYMEGLQQDLADRHLSGSVQGASEAEKIENVQIDEEKRGSD